MLIHAYISFIDVKLDKFMQKKLFFSVCGDARFKQVYVPGVVLNTISSHRTNSAVKGVV